LTKEEEVLEPADGQMVRIYHCGPTVYKRPHLGNMRRFLFADFLRRALEANGFKIKEIMNITDVGHLTRDDIDEGEDKLEKEAREKKLSPQDVARRVTEQFLADLDALNIQRANRYPKASDHIAEMVEIIEKLIERGHAYQTDTGVYYDVTSFEGYGKLSGNSLDKIEAGSRVAVRGEKKHPADFALWKIDDPEHLQQWDSPWGRGYPGWHIECSAMSKKYLGDDIDIHTGGEDNKFPHHENEIAQSEGAGDEPFVRIWMHNAHLVLGEAKLAKSEGEQLTLDTLRERGYSPIAYRLLVFASHYRSKMNFSWSAMDEAAALLDSLKQLMRILKDAGADNEEASYEEEIVNGWRSALGKDLNTPEALAVLIKYMHWANSHLSKSNEEAGLIWATLMEMDKVLGVMEIMVKELSEETVPADIQALADKRIKARAERNFDEADRLRGEIEAKGYVLEDTDQGARVIRK